MLKLLSPIQKKIVPTMNNTALMKKFLNLVRCVKDNVLI